MSAARFEVVRTDAGWHSRFRAGNGQIVWATEPYTRRRAAVRAVELIVGAPVRVSRYAEWPEVDWAGNRVEPTEVRDVDERSGGAA